MICLIFYFYFFSIVYRGFAHYVAEALSPELPDPTTLDIDDDIEGGQPDPDFNDNLIDIDDDDGITMHSKSASTSSSINKRKNDNLYDDPDPNNQSINERLKRELTHFRDRERGRFFHCSPFSLEMDPDELRRKDRKRKSDNELYNDRYKRFASTNHNDLRKNDNNNIDMNEEEEWAENQLRLQLGEEFIRIDNYFESFDDSVS
jgi:hypothetical protein